MSATKEQPCDDSDSKEARECGARPFSVAVCAGMASGLTIGQAQYAFGVFVEPIAEEFPSWSRMEINSALSIGLVAMALAGPIAGTLVDRWGVRRVVPAAALVCGCGWLLLFFAQSLYVIYASFVLVYLAFPVNTMLQCGKVVGSWFPRSRSKVLGIVSAGNNLGGVLMIQTATLLLDPIGWRNVALVFAALQGGVAVLYALAVLDTRPSTQTTESAGTVSAAAKTSSNGQPAYGTSMLFLLKQSRFYAVALALALCFWTYAGVLTQIIPALRADGLPESEASWCMSLVGVTGIGSKIASGFSAAKIGGKRTMQLSLLIQLVSLILFMLHGWVVPLPYLPAVAVAASLLYGTGFGAVGALIPVVCLEEFGLAAFGKAAGLVQLTFLAPGLLGPIAAGTSYDVTGQYTSSFALTACVFCAAIVVLEILVRTKNGIDDSGAEALPSGPKTCTELPYSANAAESEPKHVGSDRA